MIQAAQRGINSNYLVSKRGALDFVRSCLVRRSLLTPRTNRVIQTIPQDRGGRKGTAVEIIRVTWWCHELCSKFVHAHFGQQTKTKRTGLPTQQPLRIDFSHKIHKYGRCRVLQLHYRGKKNQRRTSEWSFMPTYRL